VAFHSLADPDYGDTEICDPEGREVFDAEIRAGLSGSGAKVVVIFTLLPIL